MKLIYIVLLLLALYFEILYSESSSQCKGSVMKQFIIPNVTNAIKIKEKQPCQHLVKVSELVQYPQIYRMVYHNVLESIGDLMLFWKRHNGVFFIDDLSGIEEKEGYKYFRNRGIEVEFLKILHKDKIDISLQQSRCNNFILICEETNTDSIIITANQSNLFSGDKTWIIVGSGMPKHLQLLKILPQSSITLMIPNVMEYRAASKVNIFDVFYGHHFKKVEYIQYAAWDEIKGLSMMESLNPKNRKHRLRGRMLRAVAFQHKSYTIISKSSTGSLQVTGYMKDLVDMIMDTLNIRYTIKEVESVYGMGINGTYTGIVGILHRKEAEFTLNVLAKTSSRLNGIRYAGPVIKGFFNLCYKHTKASMTANAYLLPFPLLVWIVICNICFAFLAVIAIITLTSPSCSNFRSHSKHVHKTSYRIITGTFFEEVMIQTPGIPAKIIYGTFLISIMLVFIYYSSIFKSFLVLLDDKAPFDSLEDLINQKSYSIIFVQDNYIHDVLKNSKQGIFSKTWTKILTDSKSVKVYDMEIALKIMKTGKYAYLADEPSTFYGAYLTSDVCSISFTSMKYLKQFYFFTSRLDFPYSKMISMGLMRAMESGLLQKLGNDHKLNGKRKCDIVNSSSSLGFNQVVGVFVVWLCGITLALLALCFERFSAKWISQITLK